MDRKEFLSLLGIGSASLIIGNCIGGCSKSENSTSAPSDIDVTLDLNQTEYSSLKTKGNYVNLSQGIVVAYGIDGNYYAVQLGCPHEGGQIYYNSSLQKFNCNKHSDQTFTNSGISNKAQTSTNLKTYTCTLNGTNLNIKG